MTLEYKQAAAYKDPNIAAFLYLATSHFSPTYTEYKSHIPYYEKIRKIAQEVVGQAISLPENVKASKKGGCLVVFSPSKTNTVELYGEAKNPDEDYQIKQNKYILYGIAKAMVLIQNPEFVSSKQNQDLPPSDQIFVGRDSIPEGGIRLSNGDVLAFSGFKGNVDEAICVAIGLTIGQLTHLKASEISQRGGGNSLDLASQFISKIPSALVIRT